MEELDNASGIRNNGNCLAQVLRILNVIDFFSLTALVPRPSREARRIPLWRQERHCPRPRSPTPRLLKGSWKGPSSRSPVGCSRKMVQQGGREKDHRSWWCCRIGCISVVHMFLCIGLGTHGKACGFTGGVVIWLCHEIATQRTWPLGSSLKMKTQIKTKPNFARGNVKTFLHLCLQPSACWMLQTSKSKSFVSLALHRLSEFGIWEL